MYLDPRRTTRALIPVSLASGSLKGTSTYIPTSLARPIFTCRRNFDSKFFSTLSQFNLTHIENVDRSSMQNRYYLCCIFYRNAKRKKKKKKQRTWSTTRLRVNILRRMGISAYCPFRILRRVASKFEYAWQAHGKRFFIARVRRRVSTSSNRVCIVRIAIADNDEYTMINNARFEQSAGMLTRNLRKKKITNAKKARFSSCLPFVEDRRRLILDATMMNRAYGPRAMQNLTDLRVVCT